MVRSLPRNLSASAMAMALARRLSNESRTVFAAPSEPDVLTSSARSG